LQTGTVLHDRFRLTRLQAEGGCGRVWAAEHVGSGQQVVVKVLRADLAQDAQHAERFARETKALAKLDHRNIVRVIDVGGLESGATYLVMEKLTGIDLREALKTAGGRMAADRMVPIAVQALAALEAVHAGGLVHRDLKPDNLSWSTRRASATSSSPSTSASCSLSPPPIRA
jgi:serine/threonine-protein kinase